MIVECPGCRSRYDVSGRPPGTHARCRCGMVFSLPHPESQAGFLSCPQCGGNVSATNHQCEYCAAQLLVKACPRCFAKIFHGAKHCSHCGANVVVPAKATQDGVAVPRPCPRCANGTTLVARLVEDILLDECPECQGMFVDTCALERILSERRQARADAILGLPASSTKLASSARGPVYVKCPDCDVLMNRKNFATGAGIIVDVCRNHGTWFDAQELSQVINFVMKGGLERAARKDQARFREEARRSSESAARQSGPVHSNAFAKFEESRPGASFTDIFRAIADFLVD